MATDDVGRGALGRRREQVIEHLSEQFSRDRLDVDEFEDRVARAHRAGALDELEALVEDLDPEPPEEQSVRSRAAPQRDQALAVRPASRSMVAVLGSSRRTGPWRVPETLKVFTILGGSFLDFRDAVLPPGVTEVRFVGVLGDVEIIVPPGLPVECDGVGILGDIKSVDHAPPVADPGAPLLRLTGWSILGDVDVQMRLPGESKRDAKKRRKRERRTRKQKQLGA